MEKELYPSRKFCNEKRIISKNKKTNKQSIKQTNKNPSKKTNKQKTQLSRKEAQDVVEYFKHGPCTSKYHI